MQQPSKQLQEKLEQIEKNLQSFSNTVKNDAKYVKEEIMIRKIIKEQLTPLITIAKENMITNCYKNEELKQTRDEYNGVMIIFDDFKKELQKINDFENKIYYIENRMKETMDKVQGRFNPILYKFDQLNNELNEQRNLMRSMEINIDNQDKKIEKHLKTLQQTFIIFQKEQKDQIDEILQNIKLTDPQFAQVNKQIVDCNNLVEGQYKHIQNIEQKLVCLHSQQIQQNQQFLDIKKEGIANIYSKLQNLDDKYVLNDKKINEFQLSVNENKKHIDRNKDRYLKQFKFTPFQTISIVSDFMQEFLCAPDQHKLIQFENQKINNLTNFTKSDISLENMQQIQDNIQNAVSKEQKGLYRIDYQDDFKSDIKSPQKNNESIFSQKLKTNLEQKKQKILMNLNMDQKIVELKEVYENIKKNIQIKSFEQALARLENIQAASVQQNEEDKKEENKQKDQNDYKKLKFALNYIEKNVKVDSKIQIKKRNQREQSAEKSQQKSQLESHFISIQNEISIGEQQNNLPLEQQVNDTSRKKEDPGITGDNQSLQINSSSKLNANYSRPNSTQRNIPQRQKFTNAQITEIQTPTINYKQQDGLNQLFESLLHKISTLESIQKTQISFNQLHNTRMGKSQIINQDQGIQTEDKQTKDEREMNNLKEQVNNAKINIEESMLENVFQVLDQKQTNQDEKNQIFVNQLHDIFNKNLSCSKCGFSNHKLKDQVNLKESQLPIKLGNNHISIPDFQSNYQTLQNRNSSSGIQNSFIQVIYIKSISKIEKLQSRYLMKKRKWLLTQIDPAKRFQKKIEQEAFFRQKELEMMLNISEDQSDSDNNSEEQKSTQQIPEEYEKENQNTFDSKNSQKDVGKEHYNQFKQNQENKIDNKEKVEDKMKKQKQKRPKFQSNPEQIQEYLMKRKTLKQNLQKLEEQVSNMLLTDLQKDEKKAYNPFVMKNIVKSQTKQHKINMFQSMIFEQIQEGKITMTQAREQYKSLTQEIEKSESQGNVIALENINNQVEHMDTLKRSNNSSQNNNISSEGQQSLSKTKLQQQQMSLPNENILLQKVKTFIQQEFNAQSKIEKQSNLNKFEQTKMKIETLKNNLQEQYQQQEKKDQNLEQKFDLQLNQFQIKFIECQDKLQDSNNKYKQMEQSVSNNERQMFKFIDELKIEYFEYFKLKKQNKTFLMSKLEEQDELFKNLKDTIFGMINSQEYFQNLSQILIEYLNYISQVITQDLQSRQKLSINLKNVSHHLSKDQYLNSLIVQPRLDQNQNCNSQLNQAFFKNISIQQTFKSALSAQSADRFKKKPIILNLTSIQQDNKDAAGCKQQGLLFLQTMEYRNKQIGLNKILEHLQSFQNQINKQYLQQVESQSRIQFQPFQDNSNSLNDNEFSATLNYQTLPQKIFDNIYLEQDIMFDVNPLLRAFQSKLKSNIFQTDIQQSKRSVCININSNSSALIKLKKN